MNAKPPPEDAAAGVPAGVVLPPPAAPPRGLLPEAGAGVVVGVEVIPKENLGVVVLIPLLVAGVEVVPLLCVPNPPKVGLVSPPAAGVAGLLSVVDDVDPPPKIFDV